MAYDTNKLVKLGQLKTLAERVTTDYTKKSDFDTLSSKVENLVTAGGEPNVLEGVKINGVALEIAEKMVDILIASGSTNGTLSVNNVDIAVKGLAALAYKAQVSESDLDTALKAVIDSKASGETVATLVGTDTGKSVRTIANEELAAQLIPEDAKDSLNTLTEIANWIQDHPDDASAMNTAITKLQAIVEGIGDGDTYNTVLAAIEGMISEAMAGISEGATKTEKSETNGNIKIDGEEVTVYTHPAHTAKESGLYKITVDEQGHVSETTGVTKEDITGLGIPAQDTTYNDATTGTSGLMSATDKTKLDGVAENATKVEASATPGNIKINGSETPVVTIAEDTEVTEMLNEVFSAQN